MSDLTIYNLSDGTAHRRRGGRELSSEVRRRRTRCAAQRAVSPSLSARVSVVFAVHWKPGFRGRYGSGSVSASLSQHRLLPRRGEVLYMALYDRAKPLLQRDECQALQAGAEC